MDKSRGVYNSHMNIILPETRTGGGGNIVGVQSVDNILGVYNSHMNIILPETPTETRGKHRVVESVDEIRSAGVNMNGMYYDNFQQVLGLA